METMLIYRLRISRYESINSSRFKGVVRAEYLGKYKGDGDVPNGYYYDVIASVAIPEFEELGWVDSAPNTSTIPPFKGYQLTDYVLPANVKVQKPKEEKAAIFPAGQPTMIWTKKEIQNWAAAHGYTFGKSDSKATLLAKVS